MKALAGSDRKDEYPDVQLEKLATCYYAVSGVYAPSEAYKEPVEDDPYNFIDVVFGVQGRLDYEVFLLKVTDQGKWIFDACKLRELIWKHAEVDANHIKEY